MKTKKEIINQLPEFKGFFSKVDDIILEFRIEKELLKNCRILFAEYIDENYSGAAYVLFYNKTENKFYEVFGSHCSCYGLEGQWEPEEVTLKDLEFRIVKTDQFFYERYLNNLRKFLDIESVN